MAEDKLEIEILEDGTIKMTSDPISAPNHANATQFFKTIARLCGGDVSTAKRTDVVTAHHHAHATHEHHH